MADHKEYQTRLLIALGHRRYGIVAPPKEVKDDDGGTGSAGFLPSHPLLGGAVQFAGDFNLENPLLADNPEAQKAAQLLYEHQLDKKMQQQHSKAPTMKMGG